MGNQGGDVRNQGGNAGNQGGHACKQSGNSENGIRVRTWEITLGTQGIKVGMWATRVGNQGMESRWERGESGYECGYINT